MSVKLPDRLFQDTVENVGEKGEPNTLLINWKNVRMESRVDLVAQLIEKQKEETKRLKQLRLQEPATYVAQIAELTTFRSLSRNATPRYRCYVPRDFFEKRIACKATEDHLDQHTSLEVRIAHDTDDNISRQGKLRRCALFKKHLRGQDVENFNTLPFIEEDAADLISLIELSTNRQILPSRNQVPKRVSDSIQLPYMQEINDKPKAGILVSCYVKDHILKLPLMLPNAERMKELYTGCILKDEHLSRLFNTRRDILPKDLQDYISDFGANKDLDMAPKIIKDEMTDRDQFFHTSMNVHASDILCEIEIDSLEFSVFIKPCYILHFSQVMPDYNMVTYAEQGQIETYIKSLVTALNADYNNPIGKSRKHLMNAFSVANDHSQISGAFIEYMQPWIESLMRSLFSPHSPVREEACYTIAYLFTQTKLLYDILSYYSSEFVYEIVFIVFRAIDHFSSSFELFYSLIGYIMDGCPLLVILQCICDRGPVSKNYLMRKQWPKFVVFACKHWPSESFKSAQVSLKKITDLLEKFFNNKVTRKTSRMALAYIGRRFDRHPLTSTHWILSKAGPPDEVTT